MVKIGVYLKKHSIVHPVYLLLASIYVILVNTFHLKEMKSQMTAPQARHAEETNVRQVKYDS